MRPITTTALTAEQKSQVSALLTTMLAESAAAPLVVPTKKTPIIERAKALGLSLRQAQAVATKAIAQFERRALRAQAKIDRTANEKRMYNARFREFATDLASAQKYWMEDTSAADIKVALATAKLRTHPAEVRRARAALLCAQARRAYRYLYRTCVNGTVAVRLSATEAAGVGQCTTVDRNLYRGQFKAWAANIVSTTVAIHPDYWSRVSARMPAVTGGHLILDATPVRRAAKDGIDAFAATWVVQPRANSNAVETATGFIAICGALRAYGPNLDAAIASVARRLPAAA